MKTITISDECFTKLKDQILADSEFKEINALEDMVGEKFFFRTLTYHLTGKVKKIIGSILELEEASWIADSGRFRQAITDGVLDEVEPVDVDMFVNIASITDAFTWQHKLPREQK